MGPLSSALVLLASLSTCVVAQPRTSSPLGACSRLLDVPQLGSSDTLSTSGLVPRLLQRDWDEVIGSETSVSLPSVKVTRAKVLCTSEGYLRNTYGSISFLTTYDCLGVACASADPLLVQTFTHHVAFDCHNPEGYFTVPRSIAVYSLGSWDNYGVGTAIPRSDGGFNIIRSPIATFSTQTDTNCGGCSYMRNSTDQLQTWDTVCSSE